MRVFRVVGYEKFRSGVQSFHESVSICESSEIMVGPKSKKVNSPTCPYLPIDKIENNIRKIASLTIFSENDRKFTIRSLKKFINIQYKFDFKILLKDFLLFFL